jgi:large subunit ribosomal protein L13
MKTYSAKPSDIENKWWLIDADGLVLGRLASLIALRLKGKHKTTYTPHMDCGDNIVVINAEKVRVTGKKLTDRVIYWHTGYPGGVKERNMGQIIGGRFPERAIYTAVERMLKREPLGRAQMRRLRVYKGTAHPHEAQQPVTLDVKAMNPKNSRVSKRAA